MTTLAPPSPVQDSALRTRALTFLPMLGVGYTLAITKWPLHLPTTCGFKLLTGLPCPGCGMTHACCALIHGQVVDALHFNLSVIPFSIGIVAVTLLLLAELAFNRPLLIPVWKKNKRWFLWSLAVIMPLAWAVNLFNLWPG